jgi:hypothetical protein
MESVIYDKFKFEETKKIAIPFCVRVGLLLLVREINPKPLERTGREPVGGVFFPADFSFCFEILGKY